MACKSQIKNSVCQNIALSIDCLEIIYQEESKEINLTLIGSSGIPLNLDDTSSISIILYDTRKYRIAEYIYNSNNTYIDSDETYSKTYSENIDKPLPDDYLDNSIWFNNLPITLLQVTLNSNNSYATESYNKDDYFSFINKGKISFIIPSDISKILMMGQLYIDLKLVTLTTTYMINCLNIGVVKKNKFI